MQLMIFSRQFLFIALCINFLTACQSQDKNTQQGNSGEPTKVNYVIIKPSLSHENSTLTGTVLSKNRMQISSQILGRITGIFCKEGDRVNKDQLLVTVDSRDASTQIETAQAEVVEAESELDEAIRGEQEAQYEKDAAQADLTLASQNFKRYEELLKRDSVSQQEFDGANARYKSALAHFARAEQIIKAREAKSKHAAARLSRSKAKLEEAKVELTYTNIKAPDRGIVASKLANPGDIAAPGVPLITLDCENYRLEIPVDQSKLSLVNKNLTVPVTIEGLTAGKFAATVDEIVPAADPNTRSSIVKLTLPQIRGLHSGEFGRASFPGGNKSIIQVPANSIIEQGQLTFVFIVDPQSIARLRLVKTGRTEGNNVEILSGLSEGEKAIISNLDKIADGVRVEL